MVRRLRLISGLILFTYVLTHFINHSPGIASITAMGVWRMKIRMPSVHNTPTGKVDVEDPTPAVVISVALFPEERLPSRMS